MLALLCLPRPRKQAKFDAVRTERVLTKKRNNQAKNKLTAAIVYGI